jgi:flavin-dependent dehydrogenase
MNKSGRRESETEVVVVGAGPTGLMAAGEASQGRRPGRRPCSQPRTLEHTAALRAAL